ncbi:MAG TPA: glutathione S-transferase N-terminal domain-containing protein [Polyangiaceae bacterium]|nr:glutathione S-transferase N-terminal domain-containing protein [Polyangiaceae bacterium]HMR74245.1 glutathione S-transferase N-terminal domain-containing protein [Polyangiaceae bacterium]
MSTDLFPKRWPPTHPDRIQLYSLATPNGQKAGIALEELGLAYEAHRIDIMKNDQFDPDFVKLNPNSKIPTLVDPKGPDGQPIAIMESGAILLYLANKAGKLVPKSPRQETELHQWLFFQVGHIGPMFGQFGHFYKFAKGKTDTYGETRYGKEVKRLLEVLERRLQGRDYLLDDFSLADIATVPWITALDFYDAKGAVDYDTFPRVDAWVSRFLERPAVQRGIKVCA